MYCVRSVLVQAYIGGALLSLPFMPVRISTGKSAIDAAFVDSGLNVVSGIADAQPSSAGGQLRDPIPTMDRPAASHV